MPQTWRISLSNKLAPDRFQVRHHLELFHNRLVVGLGAQRHSSLVLLQNVQALHVPANALLQIFRPLGQPYAHLASVDPGKNIFLHIIIRTNAKTGNFRAVKHWLFFDKVKKLTCSCSASSKKTPCLGPGLVWAPSPWGLWQADWASRS